jgi:hypothetical protein
VYDREGAARSYKYGLELMEGAKGKQLDEKYWHTSSSSTTSLQVSMVTTRDILNVPHVDDGKVLSDLFKQNLSLLVDPSAKVPQTGTTQSRARFTVCIYKCLID